MKVGDAVLDLEKAAQVLLPSGPRLPADMLSFLEVGDEALSAARQIEGTLAGMNDLDHQLRAEGVLYTESHIRLMAPILNPRKIVCIGLNYRDHCTEQNIDLPKNPVIFTKFTTAIIGPDDEIVHPALTSQLDYEAELVFVMGKAGKHIPEGEAFDYVAGYTIGHDVSARDVQFSDKQWVRGKTFDTFAPMGPYLVTGDEVGNPHDLDIKLYLNGRLLQDSNTRHLVFNVPSLIAFLSKGFTFLPGDVVFTGTPAGVGVFRKPPIFMKPGDTVEVEIARIGRLTNRVVAGG
jgi:2-keto-4-pentenoate hydratase/2-oxohepta-3-ene-1,7-dioic acid hydratase in catechol pathway